MLYFPRSTICLMFAALVICSGFSENVQAQESPRFEVVPEGTLDTETGLIWGFGARETFGSVGSWDWASSDSVRLYYAELSEFYVELNYGIEGGIYHDDWRLPTVDQYLNAIQAGLFLDHNLDPTNPWDSKIDPLNPSQVGRWTSDTKGGKAYVVNWWSGNVELIGKNSGLNFLYVRAGNPSSGSGGKGKGGGKNK